MSDSTTKIQFLEYRKPALDSGDYKIKVEQSVQLTENDAPITFDPKEISFSVSGERFSLDPSVVHTVFPPDGGLGKYTAVLPHIAITRSTFPWERSAYGNDDYEPWLALLLFDEEEISAGAVRQQTLSLGEINSKPVARTTDKAKFPNIKLEKAQKPTDRLTVIDVKKSLLQKIIPTGDELKTLTHARRRVNSDEENPETELAVVVCNRLPREGANSVMYLVSVEERYKTNKEFNYKTENDEDYIRLVSLNSWSFACPIRYKIMPKKLSKLKETAALDANTIRTLEEMLKEEKVYEAKDDFIYDLKGHEIKNEAIQEIILKAFVYRRSFEEVIEDMSTGILRFPNPTGNDSNPAETYLSRGFVALPHKLRQLDTTWSWYHGPLGTHEVAATFEADSDLPAFGDALTHFHRDIGMFDISYSAAFELGRALALDDPLFSAALYQWKHNRNEKAGIALQQREAGKLMTQTAAEQQQEDRLEAKIKTWFKDLALLKGIPFNYLVPEEHMLPAASIRFFTIDNHWIECLLYGAFTIGGHLRTDIFSIDNTTLPETKSEMTEVINQKFPEEYKLSAVIPSPVFDPENEQWIITDTDKIDNTDNTDKTDKTDTGRKYSIVQYGKTLYVRDEKTNARLFRELISSSEGEKPLTERARSGFIVRSEIVLDYPDLQADAYEARFSKSDPLTETQWRNRLQNIRMERLAPEVLFCLYEGDAATAELYLKPEGLQFGLDEEEEGGAMKLKKELRTEYVFNSIANHLDTDDIKQQLQAVKDIVKEATEEGKPLYFGGYDPPAADGGKFEFKVSFRDKIQDKRLLDIAGVAQQLNTIVKEMAMAMTGKSEEDIPEAATTETSAQFGMYMLEGSIKGRFAIKEPGNN